MRDDDHNGYANAETLAFQVFAPNVRELHDAIGDYVADCLRRVPNMTDQTLGVNIILTVRTWVDMARNGEPIRNLGWGPAGVLPIPAAVLLELAETVGRLDRLSDTDLGAAWRDHGAAEDTDAGA